jgi:hypothetical protein
VTGFDEEQVVEPQLAAARPVPLPAPVTTATAGLTLRRLS